MDYLQFARWLGNAFRPLRSLASELQIDCRW
jgi:hypothetical protein